MLPMEQNDSGRRLARSREILSHPTSYVSCGVDGDTREIVGERRTHNALIERAKKSRNGWSNPRCVTSNSGLGEHDLKNSKPTNAQESRFDSCQLAQSSGNRGATKAQSQ